MFRKLPNQVSILPLIFCKWFKPWKTSLENLLYIY